MPATKLTPPLNEPPIGADGYFSQSWAAFFQRMARESVDFQHLPTASPPAGSGLLWNNAGTVKVA